MSASEYGKNDWVDPLSSAFAALLTVSFLSGQANSIMRQSSGMFLPGLPVGNLIHGAAFGGHCTGCHWLCQCPLEPRTALA